MGTCIAVRPYSDVFVTILCS